VRVGETLSVKPGTWTSGTSFTFKWYAGKTPIKSATGSTLYVSASLKGKKITVQVTGKKAGYSTVAKKSKATAPVGSASWATSKYGSFGERRYTGEGDDVIKLPAGAKAGIVLASHRGDSNFVILSSTSNGDYGELLVNEIGDYSGTTAFGLDSWDRGKSKFLEITADGPWEIRIRPLTRASTLPSSGRGDGVFQYKTTSTATRAISHSGDSNFVIQNYRGSSSDLVVNEIGDYSGRKRFGAGPSIVVVNADGTWRIR